MAAASPCPVVADSDDEMSKRFPLLFPMNESCTEYKGFLEVLDEHFYVHLSAADPAEPNTYSLNGDWSLHELVTASGKAFEQILGKCKSLSHFLMEFCNMMELTLKAQGEPEKFQRAPEILTRILSDLEHCGWHNLGHLSVAGDEIQLNYIDSRKQKHWLKVHLSPEFPAEAPSYDTDLPVVFEFQWHKGQTLAAVFEAFARQADRLVPFWEAAADLDARCWVLDPPCPRAGDAYRRIALGKNVSMMVVIDPHTPMTLPRLEFTGPEAEVSLHEKAVQDNVDKWDPSASISANLSALLGFEVPSRENATSEEVDCTCGICYSFLLDGAVPDELCQNFRCSRPFHQSCLSEWMRSLPMVRQNFNMFFGECPYCSEPMSCRM
ncbi:E3 ubiquitin-protein ligase FANCL [Ixodes scapularis]|uniref:E3 ubiquitin-protein ligase FANCL n=1 Tax=Ixodes scapularis TaxID=6945 RepID=UPI001A9E9C3B|nr:E3 ubiquitin-protein ligase FANCL [Ixodes scapularis]